MTDFTFEDTRRDLHKMGRQFGWKTPRGHRVSNLIEQSKHYREATGDQRTHLAASIQKTMAYLAA